MSKNPAVLEQIVLYGLYALLLTPLFFSNELLFPAMTPKLLWIFFVSELTFVGCVWLWRVKPSTRPRISQPLFLFIAFFFILCLSAFLGVYQLNSFWGSLETNTSVLVWLHLGLVLVCLLTVARMTDVWTKIALFATLVGLVVVMLQVFSFLPEATMIGFNSGSALGNSSFLGTYLLFEIFFAGLLVMKATGRMRTFGIISVVIFLSALFFSDAVGAQVSVVGGGVLFVALVLVGSKKMMRKAIGVGLVTLLFACFFAAIVLANQQNNFFHTWIIDHSSGSRFVVAGIAWESFLERPLLGWGPENFRFAFLSHFDPCFGGEYCGANILFDRAHNIFLDLLVSVGLVGLLAYAALWIVMFLEIWNAYKQKTFSIGGTVFVVSVLAAYLVQNLTVFDTAVSLLLLVFVFGFVVSHADYGSSSTRTLIAVPVLATVLLPFFLFFFVLQPLQGVASVKTAATSINTTIRFEAYEKAVSLSPFGRDVRRDFLALQTANLLWGYDPILQADTVALLKPYFMEEIALSTRSLVDTLAHSPNDLRGYLYLVKLLQAEGRLFDERALSQARIVLDQAQAHNPNQAILLWVDVALRVDVGDEAGARQKAEQAGALTPDQATIERNLQALETLTSDTAITSSERSALLLQFYLD